MFLQIGLSQIEKFVALGDLALKIDQSSQLYLSQLTIELKIKKQNEIFIKSDKQNKEKIWGFCEMGKIRKAQNRIEIRELGSELKEV